MDVNEFLNGTMKEKVYSVKEHDSEEKLQEQLNQFMIEIYERRRDDPAEGGLQASMIIMPDAFASKVTENDGIDPHSITQINLLRHLKQEEKFYIREAGARYNIIKDERLEIAQNGIEVRILDGERKIMMAFVAYRDIQSEFQLEVLKKMFTKLRILQKDGYYEHVEVGFHSLISHVEIADINEEKYQELLDAIKVEKNHLSVKNKSVQELLRETFGKDNVSNNVNVSGDAETPGENDAKGDEEQR